MEPQPDSEARCLQAGGYPSWTLGEDVRLGVELQRHGYTGYFLPDRLAVGEVPDTVRGVFMQRSRCALGFSYPGQTLPTGRAHVTFRGLFMQRSRCAAAAMQEGMALGF